MDLGVVGSLIGGVLGYQGQQQTNASNEAIANNANAFNQDEAIRNRGFQAQQAQNQMDFQERMSNTAYQRMVADAKKAGINPDFIANSGGSSTPSGAAGSGAQASAVTARMENPFQNANTVVSNALEAARNMASIKQAEAQTALLKTQNEVQRKDVPKSDLINDINDVVHPYIQKAKQWLQNTSKPMNKQRMGGPGGGLL